MVDRTDSFDVVIVGGGTAGCVFAHRLSEDSARRVLLIEAGPDYDETDGGPLEFRDTETPILGSHGWGTSASLNASRRPGNSSRSRIARMLSHVSDKISVTASIPREVIEREISYPLAKVVGGGSSINAAIAFPPEPVDFDRWAARGLREWLWVEVEPYWSKVLAGDSRKHALPIILPDIDNLEPLQRLFSDTCSPPSCEPGYTAETKARLQKLVGRNLCPHGRASSSWMYLSRIRSRPNLTIRPASQVDRIIFDRRHGELNATHVEMREANGDRGCIAASQLVLCAGAVHSAAILMRSGVGDTAALSKIGISSIIHLPGVGRHLQDHPVLTLWAVPRDNFCKEGRAIHQVFLDRAPNTSDTVDTSLFMLSSVPTARFPPLDRFLGSPLAFGIAVFLSTPRSLGRVTLQSADGQVAPRIDLNFLSDREDVASMTSGCRLAWEILQSPGFLAATHRMPLWDASLFSSADALEEMLLSSVRPSSHPTGTLRMGIDADQSAVVDQRGRLRGCKNIIVGDSSVMPVIPSAPPNVTCMVVAEKIAAQFDM